MLPVAPEKKGSGSKIRERIASCDTVASLTFAVEGLLKALVCRARESVESTKSDGQPFDLDFEGIHNDFLPEPFRHSW